jgi:transposase
MTNPARYIGIDVAKSALDVNQRPEGMTFQVSNDEAGIAELVERLAASQPALIVLEATGGIETSLVAALLAAELPAVVVNPRQVREFARATGQLAKTDAIDAGVLAQFGEAVKPEPRPLPDAAGRELRALVRRRHQLVEMLTAEKNRLRMATRLVRRKLEKHISWLQTAIAELDTELGDFIKASPSWRERDELFRSTPGVGPVLSAVLLSDLPELGSLNRKAIAALAASRRSIATAASSEANVVSGAGELPCAPPSTWPRWSQPVITQRSGPSTRACFRPASPRR